VETVPEVEEVQAVATLLGEIEHAAGWISVSCMDGARLRSGAPVEEAAQAAAGHPGVLALGVNCTAPEFVTEVTARLHAASGLPVVTYPNSGEGWDAVNRCWTGSAATRVDAAAARRWIAAGARLVGGCCRVTPDQVAAIAVGMAGAAPKDAAGSQ
jgi:homocysteine S-methyltransferase